MSAVGQKRTHATQQTIQHSITSSALASKLAGMFKPSVLAVFTLIINFVFGLSPGRLWLTVALTLRSTTIHSGDNSNSDPRGDEAVFNVTPGSFWTNVEVGRLQAAALLILK